VLEKGNFKDELDKYAQMLEMEQSTKAGDLKKADALQKEVEALTDSKEQLLAETEALQKTISDLQEKTQASEQQITDRFTGELKEKTEQLARETAKVANLNKAINGLKGNESNGKMEIDKLRSENKMVTEKYNRMAAEHAQAFSVSITLTSYDSLP